MPNSAATSVAALPLLSQSSTACCLKVRSNFFRVFFAWFTGVFIVVLAFTVPLYLCPFFRAAPDGGFQHFGEGAGLDEIFLGTDFYIPSLAGAGEGGAAG